MEIIATERNDLQFSYDLVRPLLLERELPATEWNVIEKGSEKSDPTKKYKISLNSIESALCQISQYIWRTAYNESQIFGDMGFKIYLKEERYQFSETVKARGVVYTLLQLSNEQKRKGVITASTGSFAYSLCHFGKKFEIPVTVVMPLTTTDEEIKMCRSHADSRTTVFVYGCDIVEAHNIALRFASMKGLVYIDGNDHPNMVIGQATLGIEIAPQLLKFDAIILPTMIDGCGLITGIAVAIKESNTGVEVIEVHRPDFNNHVENIRKVTNSFGELEISVTEYTWYEDSRGMLNYLFDRSIMVYNNDLIVRAEYELKKVNIDDFNAAIGLAAFLSGELDDLKEKSITILEREREFIAL